MYDIKQLTQWDDDCAYYMQDSLQGCESFFKKQVNTGASQLWQVDHGDTYFITRIEIDEFERRVLVVCCYEGRDIRAIYNLIENAFSVLDLFAVRYHTKRKGMIRLGHYHGFKVLETRDYETVMIKYLK